MSKLIKLGVAVGVVAGIAYLVNKGLKQVVAEMEAECDCGHDHDHECACGDHCECHADANTDLDAKEAPETATSESVAEEPVAEEDLMAEADTEDALAQDNKDQ